MSELIAFIGVGNMGNPMAENLMKAGRKVKVFDVSKEMIENVKSQLDAGANFADLAKEHSDCPSGQRGGDLGLFGRGAMVPTFDEAAFKLELNEVSSVIETEFGFHLIIRTA